MVNIVFEDLRELEVMSSLVESIAGEMDFDIDVGRYQCLTQAMNDLGLGCDCDPKFSNYQCPKHFGKEVHLDVMLLDNENMVGYEEIWKEDLVKKFSKPTPTIFYCTEDESYAVRRSHGVSDNTIRAGYDKATPHLRHRSLPSVTMSP